MHCWSDAMLHILASEAGANPVQVEWLTLVTTVVVFLIFFGVAAVLVWPKILAGLDERDQKIRGEIKRAEAARAEAAEALRTQEEALRAARIESNELIAKARASAEKSAADLRAKAESELTSLRAQAHREIDTAREAAIKDINAHAADISSAIAGRILEREISADDQRDLVDRTLQEFAQANAG
ncbi:MAG: F0F1 ATP synthase subunit B [Phycisphaerales bacterium]|jgi:F-type H+-transporting ATPase subunit b|nr:F0F1 ATP synthase subunit B [Phycisphaerales bacterium]